MVSVQHINASHQHTKHCHSPTPSCMSCAKPMHCCRLAMSSVRIMCTCTRPQLSHVVHKNTPMWQCFAYAHKHSLSMHSAVMTTALRACKMIQVFAAHHALRCVPVPTHTCPSMSGTDELPLILLAQAPSPGCGGRQSYIIGSSR